MAYRMAVREGSDEAPLRLDRTHVVLYEDGELWFQRNEWTQPGRRTLCNVPFDVWAYDPLCIEARNRGFSNKDFEELRLAYAAMRERVRSIRCVEPIVVIDPLEPPDSVKAWRGSLNGLFHGCSDLTDIADLSLWDVSGARDLSRMFQDCRSLADLSVLGEWDVGRVEYMVATFAGCAISTADALTSWYTDMLRDPSALFADCKELTDLSGLAGWDLSSAEYLDELFSGCSSLVDLSPLAGWDISSARSMDWLFFDCVSLATLSGLEHWHPREVTSLRETFAGCSALVDIAALRLWDFYYVCDSMRGMFDGCSSLVDLSPLAGWFPAVDLSCCFQGTAAEDLSPLAAWDTDHVEDTDFLFDGCPAEPPSWYEG